MHRDDQSRVKLANHLGSPGGIYGIGPSHRDKDYIYHAYGVDYIRGQDMAQVTHVSQAQAVHLYDKDGIAAPLCPLLVIVIDGISSFLALQSQQVECLLC